MFLLVLHFGCQGGPSQTECQLGAKDDLQKIPDDEDEQAHISWGIAQIEQFEKDPKKMDLTPPAEPPDGPPIGADEDWDFQP